MKLKNLRLLPLLLALCLALAACGGGGGEESKAGVDPAATAQALLDSGAFEGALDTVDTEVACRLYGIDYADVTDGIVYGSLSSGAEEIAIFRFQSTDAAEAALAGLEQRVEDQRAALKDYMPEEVAKLDGAIITRLGDSAILVVAADPDLAQKTLDAQ